MNKQAYYPMSNEIALELIQEFIKPGNSSLSGLFGWHQPSNNETVTLGDLYENYSAKVSLKELLLSEGLLVLPLDDTKAVLHEFYRQGYKRGKQSTEKERSIDCILEKEHVSCQYSVMSQLDKTLYRLAVLWINCLGERLHDWAIETLNDLAHTYNYQDKSMWGVYCPEGRFNVVYAYILDIGNTWHNPDVWLSDDRDSAIWQSGLRDYGKDTDVWNHLMELWENDVLFPEVSLYDFRDEILPVLVKSIETIKKSWSDGTLTINSIPEGCNKALADFIAYTMNQPLLPGFTQETEG